MGHQPLPLDRTMIFLDSCAFDPDEGELEAAEYLWSLAEAGKLHLQLTDSVQREVDHPNTPQWVKRRASQFIHTLPTSLIPEEQATRAGIKALLQGNSKSNRHDDDAEHLFELTKFGGYFVTTDKRILSRSEYMWRRYRVTILSPRALKTKYELSNP